jgi:hypothetical protein
LIIEGAFCPSDHPGAGCAVAHSVAVSIDREHASRRAAGGSPAAPAPAASRVERGARRRANRRPRRLWLRLLLAAAIFLVGLLGGTLSGSAPAEPAQAKPAALGS